MLFYPTRQTSSLWAMYVVLNGPGGEHEEFADPQQSPLKTERELMSRRQTPKALIAVVSWRLCSGLFDVGGEIECESSSKNGLWLNN